VQPIESTWVFAGPRPALETWVRIQRAALVVLGAALVFLAVAQLIWAVAVATYPVEMQFGETFIYFDAQRLLKGEPLYQPITQPPYTLAAYFPLYYWVVALMRIVAGDGYAPGRAVSILSGVMAAVFVGMLTAREARHWTAAVFASGLFLALGFPAAPWFALYKEDVLGVMLSLAAIWMLARTTTIQGRILAACFAGLAILDKQTMVAATVAGVIWLWFQNRRMAVACAGTITVLVLTCVVFFEVTTRAFLSNTLASVLPARMEEFVDQSRVLLQFQGLLLIVAVLCIVSRIRRGVEPNLVVFYWFGTLLPLTGLPKLGSFTNYWIEFAAATAILVTIYVWDGLVVAARAPLVRSWLATCLIVAQVWIVLATAQGPSWVLQMLQLGPQLSAPPRDQLAQLIDEVRTEPREVLSYPTDIEVLAGRPVLLEPFYFTLAEQTGAWDSRPLLQSICRGDVGMLVLDRPLELIDPDRGYAAYGISLLPVSIVHALHERMTNFEGRLALRYVYTNPTDGAAQSKGPACSGL
jgi:Dolichyl-phosphate-mannose-protein mannosyltransferase